MIERVETWIEHPVAGDLHVEQSYSDYRDFGGLRCPGRIVQTRAGLQTFAATITEARRESGQHCRTAAAAHAAGRRTRGSAGWPPAGGAPPAPPAVQSEKLGEGVYRITGGYVAIAVEFKDHVAILEGGQNEARGLAVIAETKRLVPAKPIRYVVNTHPHFDHSGGLRAIRGGGDHDHHAQQQPRVPRESCSTPAHARRRCAGQVEAQGQGRGRGRQARADRTARGLELHHVKDLEHSDGMLISFLPKERVLFTGDFNFPPAGQAVSPAIKTLVDNTERLKLDFDRHVTVHAPTRIGRSRRQTCSRC